MGRTWVQFMFDLHHDKRQSHHLILASVLMLVGWAMNERLGARPGFDHGEFGWILVCVWWEVNVSWGRDACCLVRLSIGGISTMICMAPCLTAYYTHVPHPRTRQREWPRHSGGWYADGDDGWQAMVAAGMTGCRQGPGLCRIMVMFWPSVPGKGRNGRVGWLVMLSMPGWAPPSALSQSAPTRSNS